MKQTFRFWIFHLEVGVIAEIVGSQPGQRLHCERILMHCRLKKQTGLPFASKNDGVMHACGHDFHTASMIGAAILLQQRRSELKGTVRIIFQPAEEIAQGAVLS